jgi:hypothetical protein
MVVVTASHWGLIRSRCRDAGIDVDAAITSGRLAVWQPEPMLAQLMYRDLPDRERFETLVAERVRRMRGKAEGLRVFGEAVDVLVRQNQFDAAERLEEYWDSLVYRESIDLLCSYSAEHFGNPRDAGSLRRICGLHAHVHAFPEDVLASFLLKTHAAC